jgi:hypothetical protein
MLQPEFLCDVALEAAATFGQQAERRLRFLLTELPRRPPQACLMERIVACSHDLVAGFNEAYTAGL